MDAFRNNKRVEFEALQRVSDGAGGWTQQWSSVVSVWAQFSPERGRERIQQGRVASALAGVLRVRSSSETRQITTQHRVTVDGTVYNIRAISNPDQRSDMLELTLEA